MKKFALLLTAFAMQFLFALNCNAQETKTIERMISAKLKIDDNIIVVNKTPFLIDKVSVLHKEDVLGTYENLTKKDDTKFKSDGLKSLRGENITIKIDSKQADEYKANFDIELSEEDDDLVITIISNIKKIQK